MSRRIINLCSFGPPDLETAGVFDDTIESVANLVRLSGAIPVLLRNKINHEGINIIWGAGAHYSPSFENILQYCNKTNTIVFNMEQINSTSPLVTQNYLSFLSNFRVFDYSIHNIRAIRKLYPLISGEEFPLIPSTSFCTDFIKTTDEKKYHFAFYGALNERRRLILERIQASGVRIKYINGAYGQSLSQELNECNAVINIHAYETKIFETARSLRPIAMGIPIVSETSLLPQLIDWKNAPIKFVDYNDFADYCIYAQRDNFSELNEKNSKNPEFLYNYYKKPDLLKSIRYLLGID
jgi:hypothetical protein